MDRSDRRFFIVFSACAIILFTLPTLFAHLSAGPDHVFGGVLVNPYDGFSYIAKAYQGWEGNWRVTLPYTAEAGEGAFIHLYYVLLGHTARMLRLPIAATLNAARIAGSFLLVWTLWRFYGTIFSDVFRRRASLVISVLALGMGWVMVWHHWTADFWVAEAYPFLSSLANAHFPLGMALIVLLATPTNGQIHPILRAGIRMSLAFLLSIVSPFGVIVTFLPWTARLLAEVYEDFKNKAFNIANFAKKGALKAIIEIAAGGFPFIIYYLVAIYSDPVLLGWNAQNLTPSPVWWDILLSISPAIILGLIGVKQAPKELVVWVILAIVLIFLPHPLQRRFMMGLQVPLAGLAAVGLALLRGRRWMAVRVILLFLFFPSPILTLFSLRVNVVNHNPLLFLTRNEYEAMQWIESNTAPDDLVLSSPETGLMLPAYTGRRVVYGHPFETVDAEQEKAGVERFFTDLDGGAGLAYLAVREVDYVFVGTREKALGYLQPVDGLELVFDNGEVRIYRFVR